MLGEHPIYPVLLATDLAATRDFYHAKLGLEILTESEAAITFRCGGGTQLSVTKSTTGTADTQTQASWQVTDLQAEVADQTSGPPGLDEVISSVAPPVALVSRPATFAPFRRGAVYQGPDGGCRQ